MLKQNLKNILRLAYICIFLFILGFITLLPSTSSPTLAQSPWTTYEDNDPLVQAGYSEGDWQTVSIAEAVGGNLTWTDVPGAELVLYFEGSAIEILHSRGPEGGDFSIHLDGLSWPPFNGYAEQYLYGTSIQQFNIAPGVHQLVMTNGDGAFWLEAIRVQNGGLVENELTLVYADDFNDSNFLEWLGGEFMSLLLLPHGDGQAVRVPGSYGWLYPPQTGLADMAIETELRLEAGTITMNINKSDAGRYLLGLDDDGSLALYRDEVLLDSNNIPIIASGNWFALRVVMLHGAISVLVDDAEVISVVDSSPLPRGSINIKSGDAEHHAFWMDNLKVWFFAKDLVPSASYVPNTQEEVLLAPGISPDPLSFPQTQMAISATGVIAYSKPDGIWVIHPDGTNHRQITTHGTWPTWSPDGTQIAFASSFGAPTGSFDNAIFVADAGGTRVVRKTAYYHFITDPVWEPTPDGTRIAFSIGVGGAGNVHLHSIDLVNCDEPLTVCNPTALTSGNSENGHVDWSPDGNQLVFHSTQSGSDDIYIMSSAGGIPIQVTHSTPPTTYTHPAWPPSLSDNYLAVSKKTFVGPIYSKWEIYLIDRTSGSDIQQITDLGNGPLSQNTIDNYADWSLDGDTIVFKRQGTGSSDGIFTVGLAGGTLSLLTSAGSTIGWGQDCTFQLVDAYTPGSVTQEAWDLQAAVYFANRSPGRQNAAAQGLIVHAAPTMNAMKIKPGPSAAYLAWNTPIDSSKITARLAVKNSNGNVVQIWYQYELDVPFPYPWNSAMQITHGWMVGAMFDASENTWYQYWKGLCYAADAPTLDFYYDRLAAAEYGMAQANETEANAPVSGRVTHDLTSSSIRHYDFYYDPSIFTGNLGATGSALFTGQVIWFGGMPMTKGTTGTAGEISCLQDNDQNTAGWRYCVDEDWVSINWAQHQGMITYYVGSGAPIASYINTLLSQGMRGQYVSAFTAKDHLNVYVAVTDGRVRSPAELNTWASTNLAAINAGDYLFINPEGFDKHGFLVAGWGPIQDCKDAIATTYTNLPVEREENTIPYIIDFSGGPNDRVQTPVARPFYCSKYRGGFGEMGRHEWYFFTLPDSVTIAPQQLYLDSE
ncbi:MAG: hypothetical protein F9K28_10685 [Bacteroidetes bacterium]|nr:MAG: hypothetical protein F9K28_10685 [Bacteroidota bacterium]